MKKWVQKVGFCQLVHYLTFDFNGFFFSCNICLHSQNIMSQQYPAASLV